MTYHHGNLRRAMIAAAATAVAEHGPAGLSLRELARRAGARRLLLTHIAPWTDRAKIHAEARAVYDGPLELVEQGATYEI
jgi:hypothetical protein